MTAHRGEIDLPSVQVQQYLAGRLRDIGVEQRTGLLGDRRQCGNILDHTDFVVHRHDADQQGRDLQCLSQHVGVQQSIGTHRQEYRLEPLRRQIGHRLQHAFVLGRHRDHPAPLIARVQREAGGTLDRDVVALGRAGRENQLLRVRADQRGNMRPCVLDRGFGLGSHHVLDAVRVAVVLGEPGQHRRYDPRIAARGRLVVEIDWAVRPRGRSGVFMATMWVQAARDTSASRSRAAMHR